MRDADILRRLDELGLELPPLPEPVASYIPVTQAGSLVFVAGQVAIVDGRVLHPGSLGEQVSVEMGQEAAARAALQALSAHPRPPRREPRSAGAAPAGHGVRRGATPEFVEHPTVANGASDVLSSVLGPDGRHARAAVGVASLPLGASVEITVTAEVSG